MDGGEVWWSNSYGAVGTQPNAQFAAVAAPRMALDAPNRALYVVAPGGFLEMGDWMVNEGAGLVPTLLKVRTGFRVCAMWGWT